MSVCPLEYWQTIPDPFAAVRTGWTEADFNIRNDSTVARWIEFRPTDIVLDYGCGPGYAAKIVAPKVKRYVGMDYSPRMAEIAAQRNAGQPNAVFVVNDGAAIPDPENTYDVVFCELVFQHLARQVHSAIVGEMVRVLKPDGRALLQFPTMFYGKEIGWTESELQGMLPGWGLHGNEHYFYAAK